MSAFAEADIGSGPAAGVVSAPGGLNLEPCVSAVTPEEFRIAYPKLRTWIEKTLAFYEENAQPVASMHFVRLPLYFDQRLLEIIKFVAVDRVPMPPLSAMGLSRFAAFVLGDVRGITYEDRYFIKRTVATEEPLHFHELIHVIQWRLLGPAGFLAAYANGLDEFGYDNDPLEKMAYDAEASFKRSSAVFDAEKFVVQRLSLFEHRGAGSGVLKQPPSENLFASVELIAKCAAAEYHETSDCAADNGACFIVIPEGRLCQPHHT